MNKTNSPLFFEIIGASSPHHNYLYMMWVPLTTDLADTHLPPKKDLLYLYDIPVEIQKDFKKLHQELRNSINVKVNYVHF